MKMYNALCASLSISPQDFPVGNLAAFSDVQYLAESNSADRLWYALYTFFEIAESMPQPALDKVDRQLLDTMIAKLDQCLSAQLDAIMHHPDFKQLESTWLALAYLTDKLEAQSNAAVYLLNMNKVGLSQDFDEAMDLTESGLYYHLYDQSYDMPGGKPFSAMVSGYTFSHDFTEVALLTHIASVSELAHCPFIANVDNKLFGQQGIQALSTVADLGLQFEKPEYLYWNQFREKEASKYIGLCFPSFLIRLPYGSQNPVNGFIYEEKTDINSISDYCFAPSSFAFAGNLLRSFTQYGWAVNIRGPESGGKVDNLLLHAYEQGGLRQFKMPTALLISESLEMALADLGIIPFSYYKDTTYACFFSANALKKPSLYPSKEATANSRVNARLPYVFLASRLGHYLKVIQRENIGGVKDARVLEEELNTWLNGLVTKMLNPSPSLMAERPLKEAKVVVAPIPDNPGYFTINLQVVPHFQVEGVDVRLSLVSQLNDKSSVV